MTKNDLLVFSFALFASIMLFGISMEYGGVVGAAIVDLNNVEVMYEFKEGKYSDKIVIEHKVAEKVKVDEFVPVIIELKDLGEGDDLSGGVDDKISDEEIKENQDIVLSSLSLEESKNKIGVLSAGSDVDFDLDNQYKNVNMISGKITKSGLEKLKSSGVVKSVYSDPVLNVSLSESVPLINGDTVWNVVVSEKNLTGTGQTVCVIDTGIDSDHEAFVGRIVDEKCFCRVSDYGQGGCCPNQQVEDNNSQDDNNHGSHATGIAAGDGQKVGVAPGAGIISVKICDSGGSCSGSDLIAGIDYCVEKMEEFNVSVISGSLGDGGQYDQASCPTFLDATLQAAFNSNITQVFAAGNEGYTSGINYPACSPYVMSVGATDKSDNVAGYSNRGALLDVFAPGSSIVAPYIDGYGTKSGTSMATPHAAGAALIVYQNEQLNDRKANMSVVKDVLRQTGVDVAGYPRIDVYSAIVLLNDDGELPVIADCGSLNQSGRLVEDVTGNGSVCFNITEDNVVLDCGGNSVIGEEGVFVEGNDNVTLRNCTLNSSIVLENVSGVDIEGLIVEGNFSLSDVDDVVVSDFVIRDYEFISVSNMSLERSGVSGVRFMDELDVISSSLDDDVMLSENQVFVNNSVFNQSAEIKLHNISYSNPVVVADFSDNGNFVDCPEDVCKVVGYNNGVLSFNVTHFTSYKSSEGDLDVNLSIEHSFVRVEDYAEFFINISNTGNVDLELNVSYGYNETGFDLVGQSVWYVDLAVNESWSVIMEASVLLDGNYTNRINVTGVSGGVFVDWFDVKNMYFDVSKPIVSLISPANGSVLKNVTFKCNATDNDPSNIALHNNLNGWQSVASGFEQVVLSLDGVSDGSYIWNCIAEDTAGNKDYAAENHSFVIDGSGPSISIDINNTDLRFMIDSVEIEWSASDDTLAGKTMNISYPNGSLLYESVDSGEVVLSPDNLTEIGDYIVLVYADDQAGNINKVSQTVNVDITCGDTITRDYNLSMNILGQSNCINLHDDIEFDCRNYQIKGDGSGIGIDVDRLSDVDVKNCDIKDFDKGLRIRKSDNVLIKNISFDDTDDPLVIEDSENVTIEDVVLPGLVVEDTDHGLVEFLDELDIGTLRLDDAVQYGSGSIFVDSYGLNGSAEIKLYYLNYKLPKVQIDEGSGFTDCTICTNVEYVDNTMTFEVPHFTRFRVVENTVSSSSEGSGGSAGSTSCNHNWNCGVWSECSPDGTQSRSCVNIGNCADNDRRPDVVNDCVYVRSDKEDTVFHTTSKQADTENPMEIANETCVDCENEDTNYTVIILIILALLSVGTTIYLIIPKKD